MGLLRHANARYPTLRPGTSATNLSFPQVLVVAPGPGLRGGITSVVLAHRATPTWAKFNCNWLDTYSDRGPIHKLIAALRAYLLTPNAISRADIIHVHLAADASLIRKLPIVWFAAKMKKPVILHFHIASTESLFVRSSSWVLSALRSRAALIVALSPSWKTEFERRWPEIPTTVLPNPVSCSENRASKKPGTILFLGKLESRKGYVLLLEALPAILREFPTAQLWIAGHGEIEKGKALARKLGVYSSVRFLGWVSGFEKQRILDEAEILCLPSFAEGVPMAVLEGMAHALPVVATPVGGIPDVIANGRNGVLIPVGHCAAISDAIMTLLRNPRERRRLGDCAQETVRNLCSLDRVAAMLSDLYLKIWFECETARGGKPFTSACTPSKDNAVCSEMKFVVERADMTIAHD